MASRCALPRSVPFLFGYSDEEVEYIKLICVFMEIEPFFNSEESAFFKFRRWGRGRSELAVDEHNCVERPHLSYGTNLDLCAASMECGWASCSSSVVHKAHQALGSKGTKIHRVPVLIEVSKTTTAVCLATLNINPAGKDQLNSVAVRRLGYIDRGQADAQHERIADVYVELCHPFSVRRAR